MKISSTLTVEEADRILETQTVYRYDREWNVAICIQYQYAIRDDNLRFYARSTHEIFYKDYASCIQALQIKLVSKTLADFSRLLNRILSIASLKTNSLRSLGQTGLGI
jgi:hypothetical protein